MASPFPGMDPYTGSLGFRMVFSLKGDNSPRRWAVDCCPRRASCEIPKSPYTEARHLWKGIPTQLIGELSTHQLPPLLAPAYYVDVEPSLQVRTERTVYPDIEVRATRYPPEARPAGVGLPVAEATATITVSPELEEEEEESAIFIREADTERLITVVEILSYSNKTAGSEKRGRYLMKRRELLDSGVHLVEVDLLRWGRRVVSTLPDRPYHILVSRADEQPQGRVWSFGLADPMPNTPLPLIAPDEQVPLPLQTAYTTIYAARNFRQRLDYRSNPEPPLTDARQAYIQARLVEEGFRPSNQPTSQPAIQPSSQPAN